MTVLLTRILLFCLVPVGIFVLIKGIRLTTKVFNTQVLLELPFTQKSGRFIVVQPGELAIWQKGRLFRRTPINQFMPVIYNEKTHETVGLYRSVARKTINDGSMARMEMFSFYAPEGTYILELSEGSSISKFESMFSKLVPFKDVDPAEYFIQVRTSTPTYLLVFGILVILLGAFTILGGLIGGILWNH